MASTYRSPQPSVTASFQKLHALSSSISSSVNELEETCAQLNTPWPDLDEAAYRSKGDLDLNTESLRTNNDRVTKAAATIVAAAFQLIASVREPRDQIIKSVTSFHYSSCLRIAAELHVPDILRDAGEEGLHVNKIASKVNVDASKLSRVLRLLATHHVFNEVRPDAYANNRISAALEKGQRIDDLVKTPSIKYDKPESAVSALMCFFLDVIFKSSSVLLEALTDSRTAYSGSPARSALARSAELNPQICNASFANGSKMVTPDIAAAISSDDASPDFPELALWDLIAREAPPSFPLGFTLERLRSFHVAMRTMSYVLPIEEVLHGFDFGKLEIVDCIFDVGGGAGLTAEYLVRTFSNVKVVIQERPEVCQDGIKRMQEVFPEALLSGRISFQAHDFFTPQQTHLTHGTPIYHIKHCLLNWSDTYVLKILRHLSEAVNETERMNEGAREKARLLISEPLVSYASQTSVGATANETNFIPPSRSKQESSIVTTTPTPLTPLLPNWGYASCMAYYLDMTMLTVLHGQHRTLAHMRLLLRSSGWEIIKVTWSKKAGEFYAMIEAKVV